MPLTPPSLPPLPPAISQPAQRSNPLDHYFAPPQAPSLPATTGNRVALWVDREEIFPGLESLIGEANDLIQIDIFMIGQRTGERLVDALVARMQARGPALKVQLLYDWHEGFFGPLHASMLAQLARLKQAGAHVHVYNPALLPRNPGGILQNGNQVDHQKLLIVDRRTLATGGMNWSDVDGVNRDLMVRVDGPAAAQQADLFDEEWQRITGDAPVAVKPPLPHPGVPVALAMTGYQRQDVKPPLLAAFNAAQTSIHIAMAQFDDPDVQAALVRAHRRGVDVRVLLDENLMGGKYLDPSSAFLADYIKAPNLAVAARLQHAGIPTRWYVARRHWEELHAKYALIDGRLAAVGSTNFTLNSFTTLRETEAFVTDPALVAALESRMFTPDWQSHSRAIPPLDGWQRLGARMIDYFRDTRLSYW